MMLFLKLIFFEQIFDILKFYEVNSKSIGEIFISIWFFKRFLAFWQLDRDNYIFFFILFYWLWLLEIIGLNRESVLEEILSVLLSSLY